MGRYINYIRDQFDATRIVAMHILREVQTVRAEQHGRELDSAVGAWTKLWWHWGGGGASELSC